MTMKKRMKLRARPAAKRATLHQTGVTPRGVAVLEIVSDPAKVETMPSKRTSQYLNVLQTLKGMKPPSAVKVPLKAGQKIEKMKVGLGVFLRRHLKRHGFAYRTKIQILKDQSGLVVKVVDAKAKATRKAR